MDEFKSDDSDDDQHDRDQADNMGGIAEKDDACNNGAGSADPGPHGISSADRNGLHGLGNGEEAEYDEDDSDDARDELAESLTIFEGDGEADLKETGKK